MTKELKRRIEERVKKKYRLSRPDDRYALQAKAFREGAAFAHSQLAGIILDDLMPYENEFGTFLNMSSVQSSFYDRLT